MRIIIDLSRRGKHAVELKQGARRLDAKRAKAVRAAIRRLPAELSQNASAIAAE